MSVFEVMMLVCFGVSWPISIGKALRTKRVEGKIPVFMVVICLGYLSGILHKLFFAFDWVIVLYAINMIMVATALFLYYHYLPSAGGLWRVLAQRVNKE